MRKQGLTRRDLRTLALWAIFSEEVGKASPEETIHEFAREFGGGEGTGFLDTTTLSYAKKLVSAVHEHMSEIDRAIDKRSRTWPRERMPKVDLSILRLALAEIVYLKEVPLEVAIDEALDLADEFSTHASPKFINGVLMGALEELGYAVQSAKKRRL